jgi:thiamine-monophosphate kinase
VLRAGAKAGDFIFVTGELGGAAGGLKLLEEGLWKNTRQIEIWQTDLINRQRQPLPQISIGRILSEKNLASAMIDLSDGLSSDLAHLCAESGMGAKIEEDKIPVHRQLLEVPQFKDQALRLALDGGEDFELLFTASPKKISQLEKELKNYRFSCIGRTTANAGTIELLSEGKVTFLEPKGFRHF